MIPNPRQIQPTFSDDADPLEGHSTLENTDVMKCTEPSPQQHTHLPSSLWSRLDWVGQGGWTELALV